MSGIFKIYREGFSLRKTYAILRFEDYRISKRGASADILCG
jgi:hypothetical protein